MMNTKFSWISIVLPLAVASCQSIAATPSMPTSTPAPPGQMETFVAAALFADETSTASVDIANQTSTAEARLSPFQAALTADVLTAAVRTPLPTAAVFKIRVPASGCWMNSRIDVRMGQRVIIRASGIVNTWEGREGSSNDPNGQKGVCGAVQCPLQGTGYGALIGRVDDGKTFFVGTDLEFVPTRGGQLHFTVNDWECEDNSGVFDILVTLP